MRRQAAGDGQQESPSAFVYVTVVVAVPAAWFPSPLAHSDELARPQKPKRRTWPQPPPQEEEEEEEKRETGKR